MEPFRVPMDPELKNIIDKLANFVARNGPEFEEMTKGKQRDNPKFSFLFGGEFFPYYKMKVQEEFMTLRNQNQMHQPFNNMNFSMNTNNMPFAPWQQQSQPFNQFNMQSNFQPHLQQQSINQSQSFNQSPFPSYPGNNQSLKQSDNQNLGSQTQIPGKPFSESNHNLGDKSKMFDNIRFSNKLSNNVLQPIKESELNLAKLHKTLTDEQHSQIEKAILNAQEAKLNKLCDDFKVNLKELESKIVPIIESCTKDAISNGKAWILQNISSPKVPEIVARYLLKRVMAIDATFDTRLHLIYLINDLMHHCARKNVEDLKKALENVIVPIYCQAYVTSTTDEHKEKLVKLVSLWEKNKYFQEEILQFLKEASTSLSTYKSNLMSEYSSTIDPITRAIDERYAKAKAAHEAFLASLMNHGETQGVQGGSNNESQEGSTPSLMSVQLGGHGQRSNAINNRRTTEFGSAGEPDFNDFLNMNGVGPVPGPGSGMGNMMNMSGQANNSFYMNNNNNAGGAGNLMQQGPGPQQWNNNMGGGGGVSGGPGDQQQQQLMAMMMMMMANTGNAPNVMPPLMDQDFMQDQRPFLPDGPPHPGFNMDPKDKSIIPGLPYFELPAGLIVKLVDDEDVDYKPLDPSKLRLPAPDPPSEQLLAAVETFYSQASHEAPRNSEGWEHLGLFEFYKVKSKYHKAYMESLKNRRDTSYDQNSSGDEDRDNDVAGTTKSRDRAARSSKSSRSPSPTNHANSQRRVSSPSESRKTRVFKEFSPSPPPNGKSGGRSSRRSKSRSPRNKSNRNGPNSPASHRQHRRSRSRSVEGDSRRKRNSSPSSPRQNRSSRSPSRSPPSTPLYRESWTDVAPPLHDGEEVFPSQTSSEQQRLDDSNKGHQLMKKMGWKGAGLGINEQGTQDPISGGEVRDKSNQFKGVGTQENPYEEFRKTRCQKLYNR